MADIRMPDGTIIKNVPDGVTKADLQKRLAKKNEGTKQSYLRGLAQNIAQGFSLGFSDEITGLMVAGAAEVRDLATRGNDGQSFGQVYRETAQSEREGQQQFAQENPGTAIASEVGGALLTGGIGTARALGSTALRNAPKITRFAVPGAVGGATYGAGAADPGERGPGAVTGGAIGAGTGVALLPIGKLATKAGSWLEGAYGSLTRGDDQRALQRVAKAFEDDAVSVGDVRRNLDELSEGATITDAAGENTLGLVEGAANRPGPARQIINERLVGRNQQAGENIVESARQNLSRQLDDIEGARAAILNRMETEARPLYQRAYATEINNGAPILREMQQNNAVSGLMKKAVQDVRDDVRLPDSVRRGADMDAPNIAVWDAVKKRLDDKISSARSGAKPKRNEAARLTAIKNRLVSELDEQVPDYGQARKIWSDDASRIEALDMGLGIFNRGKRDLSLKEFKAMPQDQQELFRLGAARAIKKVIDQTPDTMTGEPGSRIFSKIFGDKETREVLREVFPDEASFREFAKRMSSEKTFREKSTRAIRNSATARREAQESFDAGGAVGDAIDIGANPIIGTARAVLRRIKPKRSDPNVDKRVAEMLTETDADAVKSALDAIENAPGWARGIKRMTPEQMQRWLSNPENAQRMEIALSGGAGTAATASR